MTQVWGVVKRRPMLRRLCGAENAPESLVLSRMSGDSGDGECGPVSLRNARRIEALTRITANDALFHDKFYSGPTYFSQLLHMIPKSSRSMVRQH